VNAPRLLRPRHAVTREVSVTFDDLPAISVTSREPRIQRHIVTRLLAALETHRAPAIGFANEDKLLVRGQRDPARIDLLRAWLDAGHELGNHTFSHVDMHRAPLDRFKEDVIRGEIVIRDLLRERGQTLRYFRHPYLNTGTDLASKRQLEEFLAERGCRVAPVTVYVDDYLFAAAYDRAVMYADLPMAKRIAEAYVPYVESNFEYYEGLSRRLLGYEVRQTLLLHANSINAARFGELALMLERRGYTFVTLERALEDEAYAAADQYIGADGVSWLQRWALDRGFSEEFLDGEPAMPWFVRLRAESGRGARLMRWWNRWTGAGRRAGQLIAPRQE